MPTPQLNVFTFSFQNIYIICNHLLLADKAEALQLTRGGLINVRNLWIQAYADWILYTEKERELSEEKTGVGFTSGSHSEKSRMDSVLLNYHEQTCRYWRLSLKEFAHKSEY